MEKMNLIVSIVFCNIKQRTDTISSIISCSESEMSFYLIFESSISSEPLAEHCHSGGVPYGIL